MSGRFILFLSLVVLIPALLFAGGREKVIKGVVSGADCAVHGTQCPPKHKGVNTIAGVLTKDGKFYYVSNVPNLYLANTCWLKSVTVEGKVYDKYSSIEAKRIKVKENGKWKVVFEDGYIFDPAGHKVKVSEAVFKDGKFFCPLCVYGEKKKM